ncbi:MAG: glycoside hydrolase family 10 protein [Pirellulales bacterium]
MRNTLIGLALWCAAVAGAAVAAPPVPAPPKSDTILLDALQYPGDAAAQAAWQPMDGSPPVSVAVAGGRNVLALPCVFRESRAERACWDLPVKLDLTNCQGIQFKFLCRDASPIAGFSFYFQSGNGWYSAAFSPGEEPGWTTVTIDKDHTRIEGSPAGWGTIRTLRVSAWRAGNADTEFYLADLGLLGGDAAIALIRGESVARKSAAERESVSQYTQTTAGLIRDLGLEYVTLADSDVTPERLKGKKIVVLPYNPQLPTAAAEAIMSFVRSGGKLVSFYVLPPRLGALVGIELGQHVRPAKSDEFAQIRATQDALPGQPLVVQQASWNITEARPVPGRGRVVARWYDRNGRDTGQAAIVVSDRGVHMTHVLLADDAPNKRRMLLAMLGNLAPDLWRKAVQASMERTARLGPYHDLAEATNAIRAAAGENRDVLARLTTVDRLRGQMSADAAAGRFAQAMTAADEARTLVTEAYASVQPSRPGEHRGFWCHDASGVPGMTWDESIKILADNGFTAILPNMLWGGTAYYPSDVLPVSPRVKLQGDQLAKCLAACKKYGIACHVWKVNWNTGGQAPRAFLDAMKQAGRTQVGFNGKPQDAWLCPSHPENQKLEIESMLEVVRKYAVDGIHFDYIRYPDRDHCFCPGCRQRFEKVLGARVANWPADVRRDEKLKEKWLEFRREQITRVVAAVSASARQIRPGVKVSAAVFRQWPEDRNTVGQDWKVWCDRGYLDFVCPMDYTPSRIEFENMVRPQLTWAGKVPCYPGIGMSVWPDPSDLFRLTDQIQTARRLGAGGFTVFNYDASAARNMAPLVGRGLTKPTK